MDLQALLQFAAQTAYRAGVLILDVYGTSDFDVSLKSDNTPLTRADLLAHELIQDALESKTQYPVLSEENDVIDWQIRKKWCTYWLIDPLDGTKEFVERNDQFTVNIALIHNNRPILGVVNAPALGYSYEGAKGYGAFKKMANCKTIALAPRTVPMVDGKNKFTLVIGRYSHSKSLARLYERLPNSEVLRLGSSLKMCHIAEGKADLYPRYGNICEWDTAAAHCILNAVGGDLTDLSNKSLRYNTKDSLLHPDFFAWADPNIKWSKYY